MYEQDYKPPATVTRAVTLTTMTENVIVKLIKMLLLLQCRTGTNWLRTEQSKHYATGLHILYLQYSTNDEITETQIEAKWKVKVGDGEEVGRNTDSGRAGIVGVISTLEHTRGLVAGRSWSLVVDTGMISHECFWAEFWIATAYTVKQLTI